MIKKKANGFKLSKNVGFTEIPLISGHFLLFVPIYFLIYVSKVRTI